MIRKNGKRKQVLLHAYAAGYRVNRDGTLKTPDGKPRKVGKYNGGYASFNYKYQGCWFHVQMHRMNCRNDNLIPGTAYDNHHDNPEHVKERMYAGLEKRGRKTLTEAEVQESIAEIGF